MDNDMDTTDTPDSLLGRIKFHIGMALGALYNLRNRASIAFGSDCTEDNHYAQIEYYLMKVQDKTSGVAKYIEQKKEETDDYPG